MGSIKKTKDDVKTFELTVREFDYLNILNLSLSYSIFKDKVISGFLYYVCTTKHGYSEDVNLQFEVDLEDKKRILKVKTIPQEAVDKAIAEK